jgi:serine/threonine protein kinase
VVEIRKPSRPFAREKPSEKNPVFLISFKGESKLSSSIDFDELKIEHKIAAGGFGTVFKAKYRLLDVAVKKLHVQDLTPEDKNIFQREVKLMKMLTCQYVVTLMGSTQVPGQPVCLIMEYIEKGSLGNLLEKANLTLKLKTKIIWDIARGMQYLHVNHIYHRDLKPDNVLVIATEADAAVSIKITDFDTARTYLQESDNYNRNYRSILERAQQARGGEVDVRTVSNMGTLPYKAPELMGTRKSDAKYIDKADVYSFAMLAYHVYTQKVPYSEDPYAKMTIREIEGFVKRGDRLPLPDGIPPEVTELIRQCWSPEPKDRPDMQTIAEKLGSIFVNVFQSPEFAGPSSSVPAYVPADEHHKSIGWIGEADRNAAENRLEHTPAGTFLIRWSVNTRSYVMSLRNENGYEHIADVYPNHNGGIKVTKKNGEIKTFANLLEYVEAMKRQKVIVNPIAIPSQSSELLYGRTPNYNHLQNIRQ